MSQLKKGAMLSYVTIILTNGIGLLLTPFIIQKLGDSEYGLYTLIGSLVGYISVLDFGLNNSIVRFVAKFRALNDKKGEENFLATTMLIYVAISLIITVCGILLYFNLDAFFNKLTEAEIVKAKIMFMILVFNLAITLPGGAFSAICSGYEQFVFPRALSILKYLVRSAMVVGLLLYGGDAVSIVILDTVLNIVLILINMTYVLKKLKVVFCLHKFEFTLIKEIFSYSVWIFVFALTSQFHWKAGQVVLGVMSGTTAVAIYGVGIILGTYYGAFSTAISGVFLPRATQMSYNNASGQELTSMMIKIGRLSLLSLLLILGGFTLYGGQFVHLWVGETYKKSWLIALIIMVAYTIPLVQAFANSILEAKNKHSFKAILYFTLIALGTVFGASLVDHFGEIGMVVGTICGWVLGQIILNVYYVKVVKLDMKRFFKELYSGLIPGFILILGVGYIIDFIPGTNWVNLILKILLFTCVFIIFMIKIGINNEEINLINGTLPYKIKNK